ncbi:low quality protein: uncharacterized protein kiaa1143 homolog [Plakobranchus ocellatus]|uniref:Low quality protein: uncharacterized protein kiaa1143 homolog n=1 Tax=Plakobranchus ocellatus TaxID=259542 RepID=A0AAV4BZ14_9GAST|nr:low quality protein: uncharacterized protein kiaa1143 homolog [Plakobranchus ocellatus]
MPRHGVQYVNNEEPSFIRQFKQRIGHKDAPDINAKHSAPKFDEDSEDEDAPEPEDEKPVVVVLKSGHLTEEEAQAEQTKIDQGPARLDEKIKFKKPTKRGAEVTEESQTSLTEEDEAKKKKKNKLSKKSSSSKPKHNSSLLSFGDEEEDEQG